MEEYYGIRILKDGTWLYGGTPITRHNLVKLFASVLKMDAEGGYWLETPFEKGRIEVEDVPFTAVALQVESHGPGQVLKFRTNLDDEVTAGPGHPLRAAHNPATGETVPYVMVRAGLEARILRPVYYDLVKIAVAAPEAKGVMGVWSSGVFYPIGQLNDNLENH